MEIHNDDTSSDDDSSSEEEIIPVKKNKKVKFEEKKEDLETIIESPVNYHSDSGMLYKRPHDIFGRPIKRF